MESSNLEQKVLGLYATNLKFSAVPLKKFWQFRSIQNNNQKLGWSLEKVSSKH